MAEHAPKHLCIFINDRAMEEAFFIGERCRGRESIMRIPAFVYIFFPSGKHKKRGGKDIDTADNSFLANSQFIIAENNRNIRFRTKAVAGEFNF